MTTDYIWPEAPLLTQEAEELRLMLAEATNRNALLAARIVELEARLNAEPCAVCRMRPALATARVCEVCR